MTFLWIFIKAIYSVAYAKRLEHVSMNTSKLSPGSQRQWPSKIWGLGGFTAIPDNMIGKRLLRMMTDIAYQLLWWWFVLRRVWRLQTEGLAVSLSLGCTNRLTSEKLQSLCIALPLCKYCMKLDSLRLDILKMSSKSADKRFH